MNEGKRCTDCRCRRIYCSVYDCITDTPDSNLNPQNCKWFKDKSVPVLGDEVPQHIKELHRVNLAKDIRYTAKIYSGMINSGEIERGIECLKGYVDYLLTIDTSMYR